VLFETAAANETHEIEIHAFIKVVEFFAFVRVG
jgi:hypothetical protein